MAENLTEEQLQLNYVWGELEKLKTLMGDPENPKVNIALEAIGTLVDEFLPKWYVFNCNACGVKHSAQVENLGRLLGIRCDYCEKNEEAKLIFVGIAAKAPKNCYLYRDKSIDKVL